MARDVLSTIRTEATIRFYFAGFAALLLLATFLLTASGCSESYEVLSRRDLDQAPAIVEVIRDNIGYSRGQLLFITVPTIQGKVRVTRGAAQVLAVFGDDQRWHAPESGLPEMIASIDYRFPSSTQLMGGKLRLSQNLGMREKLDRPYQNVIWLRVGKRGDWIITEVAFETDPITVRTAAYRVVERGYTLILESGALLKVK